MADKKPAAAPAADAPAKPKLPIVPIVGAAVLSAALVGGVMFFMMPKAAPAHADGEAAAAAEGEEGEGEGEGDAAAPKEEVRYVEIKGPLIVNLTGGNAKYLQIEVQMATRTEPGQKAIETHMPAIRSALLMLFRTTTAADLDQPDATPKLQAKALEEANRVMEEQTGKKKVVDQLLFTSFVTQ